MKKFPVEILTDEEVQKLLVACRPRSNTGARNMALITVLYRGGLRIAEALKLRPGDIDPAAGTIRVLHGKGSRARTVGLDPGAMAMLSLWIERRRRHNLSASGPLFCTLLGRPLHGGYVRNLMPRLAGKAGVHKRVHCHGLRHTHAAQLASEGVPINVIQKQLGHGNVATTSRYIDHIQPVQVIEAMQARDWKVQESANNT